MTTRFHSLAMVFALILALTTAKAAFAGNSSSPFPLIEGFRDPDHGSSPPRSVLRQPPAVQTSTPDETQDSPLLEIQTVPPLAGIQFSLDGVYFETGGEGRAEIRVVRTGAHQLEALPYEFQDSEIGVEFARWGDAVFTPQRDIEIDSRTSLEVGFNVSLLVRLEFIGLDGVPVSPDRISSVEIRNSLGDVTTFAGDQKQWLQAGQVLGRDYGLEQVDVVHTVQNVIVDGSNVVNRGQQRFVLTSGDSPQVQILLYPARFTARDAFFGFPVGRGILLEFPDGRQQKYDFWEDRSLRLESLARGNYRFKAVGAPGIALHTLFVLSREQEVSSIVISIWDLLVVLILGLIIFPGLLIAGRPGLLNRFRETVARRGQGRNRSLKCVLIAAAITALLVSAYPARAQAMDQQGHDPIPLLAYYYIWFDYGSWDRAKKDIPLVGPYSSDEGQVLLQHVRWAKMAGIDGFIVSWKSTDRLNRRLEKLVGISAQEGFKLAIIYQGLDFERRPLSLETISADLGYFAATYADHSVFDVFGRPLVIWSGTWEFTREEISKVTNVHRDRLLILASERHAATYWELAGVVDGNAYYWSSVDPERSPDYQEKLNEISAAVHESGGLWIAPAAPGFDARLIEGTRVVERKDGETLIKQLGSAYASSPDAVGLISWNEFSENTHIEPSESYGMRALEVLAGYQDLTLPDVMEFASSEPPVVDLEPNFGWAISMGAMGVLVLISLVVIIRRGARSGMDTDREKPTGG